MRDTSQVILKLYTLLIAVLSGFQSEFPGFFESVSKNSAKITLKRTVIKTLTHSNVLWPYCNLWGPINVLICAAVTYFSVDF